MTTDSVPRHLLSLATSACCVTWPEWMAETEEWKGAGRGSKPWAPSFWRPTGGSLCIWGNFSSASEKKKRMSFNVCCNNLYWRQQRESASLLPDLGALHLKHLSLLLKFCTPHCWDFFTSLFVKRRTTKKSRTITVIHSCRGNKTQPCCKASPHWLVVWGCCSASTLVVQESTACPERRREREGGTVDDYEQELGQTH